MSGIKQQGILPYTLIPKTADKPATVAFLLWKDKKATALQSATYWAEINCENAKEDQSVSETVSRSFSEKTCGLFAPTAMIASARTLEKRIRYSREAIQEKLDRRAGVVQLVTLGRKLFVVPVRFVDATELNRVCAHKGQAEWVKAQDLLSVVNSDTSSVSLSVAATDDLPGCTPRPEGPPRLPLYLAFTAMLRMEGSVDLLSKLVGQFGASMEAKGEGAAPDEGSSLESKAEAAAGTGAGAEEKDEEADPLAGVHTLYCCFKCRKTLFTNKHLVPHEPRAVKGDFAKKRFENPSNLVFCGSFFITPASTLGEFSEAEGQIQCPKCKARVGYYTWSGSQCSCGKWITPGLQVTKSKVDARPFSAAALASPVTTPQTGVIAPQ